MLDLFEETLHREGMKIDSGIPEKQAKEEAREEMHRCEIQWVIREFYPDGKAAADYFLRVEKHRGIAPAKRLRDDCREAWRLHREKVDSDKVNS
jgi:hypothetical protein